MEWIQQLIQDLQKYMAGKPEISMCFLFGSYSKGQETLESDLDIAVYFQPAGNSVEWEEVKEYPGEEAHLSRFIKLRNILAHEYLDLRFRRIREFIQESEEGILLN